MAILIMVGRGLILENLICGKLLISPSHATPLLSSKITELSPLPNATTPAGMFGNLCRGYKVASTVPANQTLNALSRKTVWCFPHPIILLTLVTMNISDEVLASILLDFSPARQKLKAILFPTENKKPAEKHKVEIQRVFH